MLTKSFHEKIIKFNYYINNHSFHLFRTISFKDYANSNISYSLNLNSAAYIPYAIAIKNSAALLYEYQL